MGELTPLLPYDDLKQPDDEQEAPERPRSLCCFCGGSSVKAPEMLHESGSEVRN